MGPDGESGTRGEGRPPPVESMTTIIGRMSAAVALWPEDLRVEMQQHVEALRRMTKANELRAADGSSHRPGVDWYPRDEQRERCSRCGRGTSRGRGRPNLLDWCQICGENFCTFVCCDMCPVCTAKTSKSCRCRCGEYLTRNSPRKDDHPGGEGAEPRWEQEVGESGSQEVGSLYGPDMLGTRHREMAGRRACEVEGRRAGEMMDLNACFDRAARDLPGSGSGSGEGENRQRPPSPHIRRVNHWLRQPGVRTRLRLFLGWVA